VNGEIQGNQDMQADAKDGHENSGSVGMRQKRNRPI